MAEDNRKSALDVMVYPNEFVWVVELSGSMVTRVGPCNITLQPGEKLVQFDAGSKRFREAPTAQTQSMVQVPEGYYVRLANPAAGDKHPIERDKQQTPPLEIGKVVNIPGPTSFALWPGQVADVIEGHRLRANSYLVARVYNVEAVKASGVVPGKELALGQLLVIRGDQTEFFIPPTGLEVLADDEAIGSASVTDVYVRDAVTLERLEYCLLRDQSGEKRYVQGPAIVFPEPTEDFVSDTTEEGLVVKKFRAYELHQKQGLYIKVIADYEEVALDADTRRPLPPVKNAEGEDELIKISRRAGEELFLTGETTPIYFPRIEHSLIMYGAHVVHAGVAIPAGQGRYVHQRLTGVITLVKGPNVYLPDPRFELIARRTLPKRYCELMYPGNTEVLVANGHVTAVAASAGAGAAAFAASTPYQEHGFIESDMLRATQSLGNFAQPLSRGIAPPVDARLGKRPPESTGTKLVSSTMDRQGQYQGPRTITLDGRGKYEGAVAMTIWSGYAVLLVRQSGPRRVVQGPTTALLEYDEFPHILSFSKGQPKSATTVDQSVYLRVKNNWVTDIVEFETKDFCSGTIKICYRLDFEGDGSDSEKWFAVENYVKLLADHMRSLIRAEVRSLDVKEFYARPSAVLETLILGEPDESGERRGYEFEENGMHVHGIEVLKVSLGGDVQKLIETQEINVFKRELELEERGSKMHQEIELLVMQRELDRAKDSYALEQTVRQRRHESDVAETRRLGLEFAQKLKALENGLLESEAEAESRRAAIEREREQATIAQVLERVRAEQALDIQKLEAETTAAVEKFKAFSPDIVAALEAFGERDLLEKLARSLGTQGFFGTLGGESAVDVLGQLLAKTGIGEKIPRLLGNGSGSRSAAPAAE